MYIAPNSVGFNIKVVSSADNTCPLILVILNTKTELIWDCYTLTTHCLNRIFSLTFGLFVNYSISRTISNLKRPLRPEAEALLNRITQLICNFYYYSKITFSTTVVYHQCFFFLKILSKGTKFTLQILGHYNRIL